ncbi:MAG: protein kinase [Nostoc sp.]|uniref:protein kinase domain-containing protein n=1 Tax=Nostoc sp. TaxID=1180 RepID=UPI002FF54196
MFIDTVLRKRYRILGSLGGGAFGDTYLAEDLDLPNNPKCVVKQLRCKTFEPEVLIIAKRLFESEAKALYRLGNLSNQIPKLFAHFEENGEFYLVQEFVEGYNLTAEIIPDSQWSEGQVIKLLQEILQVLTVVHQQNIIHRDLKPQNLMRRRDDGKIVMIDFGAVKEIKGLATNIEGQVTSTIVIGSNGYMPNEQANSKPRLCSDIYAVGVIGIQALTGKLPRDFQEDPTNGEINWRNQVNVSDRLADVLSKMVLYNFSRRYQTASEALQALSSISPPLSKSTTLWKLPFPRKLLVATGVGAGILVMLVLALFIMLLIKTSEKVNQLTCDVKLASLYSSKLLNRKPDKIYLNRKYYGSLDNNNPSGKGTMIFQDNSRYDGEFKNGKRYGCGKFLYPPDTSSYEYYIGNFVNDSFDGLGKIKWKDGGEYTGQFRNGRCEGEGTFKLADGTSRSGVWKEGNLLDSNISCNR